MRSLFSLLNCWALPLRCLSACWVLPLRCLNACWVLPLRCLSTCWVLPLCCLSTCLFASFVNAQTNAIADGEYYAESGWGTMVVSSSKLGQSFNINVLGTNFHSCTLDQGTLKGLRGEALDAGMESPCIIEFEGSGTRFNAQPNQACSYYCGARASVGHIFIKPSASCTHEARKQRRADFLKSYKAKQFPQAYAQLSSMDKECGNLLHWMEHDDVRNDLAVTLHKLNRKADCLSVLKQTEAFPYSSEAEIKDNFAPGDAEAYLRIANATWTNRKLCEKLK
jgi:hypothetical protein